MKRSGGNRNSVGKRSPVAARGDVESAVGSDVNALGVVQAAHQHGRARDPAARRVELDRVDGSVRVGWAEFAEGRYVEKGGRGGREGDLVGGKQGAKIGRRPGGNQDAFGKAKFGWQIREAIRVALRNTARRQPMAMKVTWRAHSRATRRSSAAPAARVRSSVQRRRRERGQRGERVRETRRGLLSIGTLREQRWDPAAQMQSACNAHATHPARPSAQHSARRSARYDASTAWETVGRVRHREEYAASRGGTAEAGRDPVEAAGAAAAHEVVAVLPWNAGGRAMEGQ